jgi:hypothetical protein
LPPLLFGGACNTKSSWHQTGSRALGLQIPAKKFNPCSSELASLNDSTCELKIAIDVHHQQLLEVALAFHVHSLPILLRRDRLDLN